MTITSNTSYDNLSSEVGIILELLKQQPSLRTQDLPAVQSSLRKVISPTFEIIFAGAFSAEKPMLINAPLSRELLYSNLQCKVIQPETGYQQLNLLSIYRTSMLRVKSS